MSSSVDNRIVNMQFNNAQFESGVKTSVKSLSDLKNGLNLEGASKGLDNVTTAAKNLSLTSIGEGISSLNDKFSALGVMGVTALVNITNAAINAGIQLIKSLTIDPVMDGLSEYETKMDAIQTIQTNTASKGTSLDAINAALQDLNNYSDLTIYNFGQMTDNIGKMTAAGLGLEDSVSVVKGMSNVAAGFGVDATHMAGATYQMSQALSAGAIKLQDWNSMQQAGMGGEMIQKSLIETAQAMGKVVDTSKPFRETLEQGWLTTDVFVASMQKMANDPSLTEAAQNVTSFTKLIGTMKESVGSGWATTWENILGNKNQSTKLFTDINNGFSALIGPSTNARNAMLSFWNANGGRDAILQALTTAFQSLMSILSPIHKAFRDIFPVDTGEKLVALSIGIRDLVERFKIGEETSKNIGRSFKGLFAVLDVGVRIVMFLGKAIGTIINSFLPGTGGLLSGLLAGTAGIGDFLVAIRNVIVDSNVFGKVLDRLGAAITFVKDVIDGAFNNASSVMQPYIDAMVGAVTSSTLFGEAITNIKQTLSDLSSSGSSTFTDGMSYGMIKLAEAGDLANQSLSWFEDMLQIITPHLAYAGGVLKDTFGKAIGFIKDKLGELTLSDVGAVLAGGGLLLIAKSVKDAVGGIKSALEPIANIKDSFANVLDGVTGSLEAFQTKLKAEALLKIAIAIGILAASIVVLSMIDEEALKKALTALSILFTELGLALLVLDKTSTAGPGISVKLVALGVAILLLVGAMKALGSMDKETLSQGTQGLAAILTILAVFLKVTSGASMQTGMMGLLGIALAVRILVNSVEKFGELDPAVLDQGIQGISGALVSLALFIRLVGKPERMISIGIGMVAIGVALRVFAEAVEAFGNLPMDTLSKGLTAVSVCLTAITIAMRLMPSGKKVIEVSAGLLIMSVALYAIAGAVAIFGSMSLETLAKGLGALAYSLGLMAGTAILMQDTLPGAAALLVMAIAINVLVPAIALLGSMELKTIGIALLAIAGIFVILGLSALVLEPLTPVILALAISVGILGAGIFLIGAGLVAFAAGLAAMAAGGGAFIVALTAIVVAIIDLIPYICTKLGEGLIALSEAIVAAMPFVMNALTALVEGLIVLLVDLTPKLTDALLQLLLALLVQLATYIEPITVAAMDIIYGFIKGIADNIGKVTEVALDVIINFLKAISSKQGEVIDLAFVIIIDFINGLADAINNNKQAINNACKNLFDAIVNAIKDLLPGLVTVGENIIKGIMKGFTSMASALVDAAKGVVGDAVDGVKNFLGIKSPSRLFAEIGMYSALGMAKGLDDYSGSVSDSAINVGSSAVESLRESMSNLGGLVTDSIDTNPTIRPVMDLSDVNSGLGTLNGLFKDNQGLTVSSATTKASIINEGVSTTKLQNGETSRGILTALTDMSYESKLKNSGGTNLDTILSKMDELMGVFDISLDGNSLVSYSSNGLALNSKRMR